MALHTLHVIHLMAILTESTLILIVQLIYKNYYNLSLTSYTIPACYSIIGIRLCARNKAVPALIIGYI